MKRFLKWFKSLFVKKEVVKPLPTIEPVIVRPSTPVSNDEESFLTKGQIGVDISHHNENVNLEVLVENVDFIYMKATEGMTFVSNVYEERADKLRAMNNLSENYTPWGAYHYYKVREDPITQADHFLKYIDINSGLPPVMDIEEIGNNYKDRHTAQLLQFLDKIEAVTGITPMIYTSFYFARDVIKPTEEFAKYPLWIAHYTKQWDNVRCPKPWKKIKIWQHTECGNINGVGWKVDLNKVTS